MAEAALPGPSKNPKGKYIRSGQRQMAYNVYLKHRENMSKTAAVNQTARDVGISKNTVFDIVKEMEISASFTSPARKRNYQNTYNKLDEAQKSTIRRHVHSFFLKNELPTCTKICDVISIFL